VLLVSAYILADNLRGTRSSGASKAQVIAEG